MVELVPTYQWPRFDFRFIATGFVLASLKFVMNLFWIGMPFSIVDSNIDKMLSFGCPLEEAPSWGVEETVFMGILTEFRQSLQVQSHLEMPGILVQLGHIQCT